jgi:hypothetical protein
MMNEENPKSEIKTKCINGELKVGDLVLSIPIEKEYSFLVGKVKRIILSGTLEHSARIANAPDDIYVDFSTLKYSRQRIAEIEEDFSEAYGEPRKIKDCILDDVIMHPIDLIRITDLQKGVILRLLTSEYNAACYCYGFLREMTKQTQIGKTMYADKEDILSVIDKAVALAGYEVLDGDTDSLIIRDKANDTDYEVKVEEFIK